MTEEFRKINDWVGYSTELYRDVFCAALSGYIAATPELEQTTPAEAVKYANDVALEFFRQQNARQ